MNNNSDYLYKFAMYLYDEAIERGVSLDQAKYEVLDKLTEAAKNFAVDGGLSFSNLGVVNPRKVLDDSIKQTEELVFNTKNELSLQIQLKQLLANLRIVKQAIKY